MADTNMSSLATDLTSTEADLSDDFTHVEEDFGGSYVFKKGNISFVIFGCFGIVGNMIVILTLGSKQALRKKAMNMFVINQSVVDFLASLFLVLTFTTNSTFKDFGLSGEIRCRLWRSTVILWSLYVASTYNMLAMTIERYLKIVHAFWYKRSCMKRQCILGMAAAWLFSIGFNFVLTIPTTVVDEKHQCLSMGHWPSETHAKVAGIFTVIVEFFIPLVVIIYCYGGIVIMLQRNMGGGDSNMAATGASEQREKTMTAAYRNTIKTLALVALMYIICWTWNQVYFLMYNLGYSMCWCGPPYIIETNLVNANCCVNPIIYAFSYDDFKTRSREILGLKKQILAGHKDNVCD